MWDYWDLSSNLTPFDICAVRCRKYKYQRFFLEINSALRLAESVLDIYFMLLICATLKGNY